MNGHFGGGPRVATPPRRARTPTPGGPAGGFTSPPLGGSFSAPQGGPTISSVPHLASPSLGSLISAATEIVGSHRTHYGGWSSSGYNTPCHHATSTPIAPPSLGSVVGDGLPSPSRASMSLADPGANRPASAQARQSSSPKVPPVVPKVPIPCQVTDDVGTNVLLLEQKYEALLNGRSKPSWGAHQVLQVPLSIDKDASTSVSTSMEELSHGHQLQVSMPEHAAAADLHACQEQAIEPRCLDIGNLSSSTQSVTQLDRRNISVMSRKSGEHCDFTFEDYGGCRSLFSAPSPDARLSDQTVGPSPAKSSVTMLASATASPVPHLPEVDGSEMFCGGAASSGATPIGVSAWRLEMQSCGQPCQDRDRSPSPSAASDRSRAIAEGRAAAAEVGEADARRQLHEVEAQLAKSRAECKYLHQQLEEWQQALTEVQCELGDVGAIAGGCGADAMKRFLIAAAAPLRELREENARMEQRLKDSECRARSAEGVLLERTQECAALRGELSETTRQLRVELNEIKQQANQREAAAAVPARREQQPNCDTILITGAESSRTEDEHLDQQSFRLPAGPSPTSTSAASQPLQTRQSVSAPAGQSSPSSAGFSPSAPAAQSPSAPAAQSPSMPRLQSLSAPPGNSVAAPPGHSMSAPSGHSMSAPPGHSISAPSGHSMSAPPGHSISAPSGHSHYVEPGLSCSAPVGLPQGAVLLHGMHPVCMLPMRPNEQLPRSLSPAAPGPWPNRFDGRQEAEGLVARQRSRPSTPCRSRQVEIGPRQHGDAAQGNKICSSARHGQVVSIPRLDIPTPCRSGSAGPSRRPSVSPAPGQVPTSPALLGSASSVPLLGSSSSGTPHTISTSPCRRKATSPAAMPTTVAPHGAPPTRTPPRNPPATWMQRPSGTVPEVPSGATSGAASPVVRQLSAVWCSGGGIPVAAGGAVVPAEKLELALEELRLAKTAFALPRTASSS